MGCSSSPATSPAPRGQNGPGSNTAPPQPAEAPDRSGGIPFLITPQPIFIGSGASAPILQDINQAIDVSSFDEIDLSIAVLSVTGSGSISIGLGTSMTRTGDDTSWLGATGGKTFTATGYASDFCPSTGKTMLRYIRWAVLAYSGFTGAVFTVSGIGRRWG